MDKLNILFFAAVQVLITNQLIAQKVQEPVDFQIYKEWQPFNPLKWEDFKGSRPDQYHGDAGSMVKIKAVPYFVKKRIKYDVYTLFNKTKSWALAQSPQLLAHEQLHFDIAELYARKIRKRILQLSREPGKKSDLKIYNNEIRKLLKESNEFDRLYDIETLHGSLPKKQKEWQNKVKNSLSALKDFAKKGYTVGKH